MNVDAGGDFAQLLIRATKCYKGANHGFDNDTTPRYDEAAAKEAWQHMLDWFDKHLRA
jgi:dienelactone hydrolase